jgi:putative spermidine/putrescine transport system permease protein
MTITLPPLVEPNPAIGPTNGAPAPLTRWARWRRSPSVLLLALPALLLLLVVFVGALATLLEYSFQQKVSGENAIGIQSWVAFFSSSYRWQVVGNTAILGLEATVGTLLVGFPTAYVLHRIRSKMWRYLGLFIVFAPLMTSVISRTYGWSLLLGDQGTLNSLLGDIGLGPVHLLYATPSVVIALVHILLPFMVFPIMTSLGQIDGALGEASRDLGARPLARLRRVILPLSMPGILAGSQLVFAMAISSFATPSLLGGGRVNVLATLVYSDVNNVQWPMASVTSYVLLLMALIILALFAVAQRRVHASGSSGVTSTDEVKGIGPGSVVWLVLVDIFVLSPLIIIVISSFSSVSYGTWPPPGWSLKWYENLAAQQGLVQAAESSLIIAIWTTVIVVIVGTAASVAFFRRPGRLTGSLETFSLAPTVVPKVAIGFAGFILIQRLGFLQGTLGIVLMHTVITLPFVIVVVSAALKRTDTTLDEAARDLGASAFRAFRTTTLVAIRPALIAAALFAFIISFDEVDMTVFLLSPGEQTLPVWMFTYMQKYQDPTLAALSTLLIGFSLIIAAIAGLFLYRATVAASKEREHA